MSNEYTKRLIEEFRKDLYSTNQQPTTVPTITPPMGTPRQQQSLYDMLSTGATLNEEEKVKVHLHKLGYF